MKNLIKIFAISFSFLIFASGCTKNQFTGPSDSNPAVNLLLTPYNGTIASNTCSGVNTITTQDVNGNIDAVASNQTVNLTSTSKTIQYYSDARCSDKVSSLVIPSGSSTTTFYFKDTQAEYFTISVTALNLNPDTESFTVISPNASILTFTGPQTVSAGQCSNAYTITTENPLGEVSDVTSNVAITLGGSGSGRFYSDSACATTPINSITVLTGTSSGQFYFKDNKSENLSFSSQAPGNVLALLSIEVGANIPQQMVFLNFPQEFPAGSCSGVYSIQSQDLEGNPSAATQNQAVTLSGPNIQVYADNLCQTLLPSPSISAGSNSISFYVSSTVAQATVLSVTGYGSQQQSVVIDAAAPSSLFWVTEPRNTATAGGIISTFSSEIKDQYGNVVPLGGANGISTNNTISVQPYQDSACTTISKSGGLTGVTSVTPNLGVAQFNVGYNKVGTIYIGVSTQGLPTICSNAITISANSPTTFTLGGQSSLQAGVCSSPFTLTLFDAYGNIANTSTALSIGLSGSGSGGFYTNSTCSGATTTSIPISIGTSSAQFYYKDTTIESLIFAASGLGSQTTPLSIQPGPASKISFSGPTAVVAGQCTGGFIIKSEDIYNNISNVTANTPISLTYNGSGVFYLDSACSTVSGNSFSIAAGSSSKSLYFKDSAAESVTATANSLTISGLLFTVSATTPSQLSITAPSSGTVGTNLASIQVKVKDQFGNSSTSPNESITLTSYSDAACLNPTTTTLSGTLLVQSNTGVANFSNIAYSKASVIYIGANSQGLTSGCSSAVTISAGAVSNFTFLNSTSTEVVGSCSSAFSINSVDGFANASPVLANTTYSLSGVGQGLFYATADCSGSSISSVTQLVGTTFVNFYFKDFKTETLFFLANNPTLGNVSLTYNTVALPSTLIALSGPSSVSAGQCSTAILISSQDIYGNNSVVSADTLVNLGGADGSFYSDSACSTSISSAKIAKSSSSTQVYFKDLKAETIDLTYSATGYSSGFYPFQVNALSPSKLTLVANPTTVQAGSCSSVFTLNLTDTYGNTIAAPSNVLIGTSGLGSGNFFSDSACSSQISSLNISSGNSSTNFYFKDLKAETLALLYTNSSYTGTSSALTVQGGTASQIVFTTPAKSVTAGQCSGLISLQIEDVDGNPVTTGFSTIFNLSGSGVSFYSTSNCSGTPITSVSPVTSSSTISFYATSTAATTTNAITVSGLGSINQVFAVNSAASNKLAYVPGPTPTLMAGTTFTPAIQVQEQDQYGNLVSADTDQITLAAYSDSACQTVLTPILAGTLQQNANLGIATFANVGYNTAGSIYIGASTGTGLKAVCSSSVTITPPSANKIVLNYTASSLNAGSCSGGITVTTKDPFNNASNVTTNTTINLSQSGSAIYYSNSTCSSAAINSVVIVSGANTQTFYLKDNKAENLILSATTSSLGSSTYPLAILPLAPTQLAVSGSSATSATVCSSAITITAEDSLTNPSSVSADSIISLTGNSHGSFYSDASCTNLISSTTIKSGNSSVPVYFSDLTTENLTLVFSGLATSVNYAYSVLNAPATQLVVTGAGSVVAGSCTSMITVGTEDASGNLENALANTTVSITGSFGGGGYYSDSACSQLISSNSFIIAAGSSSKTVYFKDNVAEALSFQFSASGLTSALYSETVTSGVASIITFSTQPPTTVAAGATLNPAIVASYSDSFGNTVFNATGVITLSLQKTGGGLGPTLNGTVSETPVSGIGTVTFSNLSINQSGSYQLSASGSGLSGLSNSIVVSGGAASQISIVTGSSQNLARTRTTPIALGVIVSDSFGNPATASVTYTIVSGLGSLNSTTTGVKTLVQTSNATTGLANENYTATSQLETASISATIPSGTTTSVSFTVNVISMVPSSNVLSSLNVLEFSNLASSLNLTASGTGLTSSVNLLTSTQSLGALSGTGVESSSLATANPTILNPIAITNGSDQLSLNDVVTFSAGITNGACSLSPSSVTAVQSAACSLTATPSITLNRNELTYGTIQSQVLADQTVASSSDFLNSNQLNSDLYTIREFSNLDSGYNDNATSFTLLNGKMYFVASILNAGSQYGKLFVTDGTVITQVSNISGNSADDGISELTAVGNYLYFNANNSNGVGKLFRLDTIQNTITQVADTLANATVSDNLAHLSTDGTNLYFSSGTSYNVGTGYSTKLFQATNTSVIQLSDLANGSTNSDGINSTVYYDGSLYFSDQLASQSSLLKLNSSNFTQISNTSNGSLDNSGTGMVSGSNLYFVSNNASNSQKLYSYNGSSNSIEQISNLAGSATSDSIVLLGGCGVNFYFMGASSANNNYKLYSYSGSEVSQLSNTAGSSLSDYSGTPSMACYNSKFYTVLSDSNGYQKLYKYDGSNLEQVSNIKLNGSDKIGSMMVLGEYLYFTATNSVSKIYRLCDSATGCVP
jgi:hypothetical protein